jgi:hypothetical protein
MKKYVITITVLMLVVMSASLSAAGSKQSKEDTKPTDQIQSAPADRKPEPATERAKPDGTMQKADKDIERAYPGYLADVTTGIAGKDAKGNDLRKNPGKHKVRDMQARSSAGFGVFLRLKKGDYKFFRLDEGGTIMAKEILATTTKTDNIYVIVKGTIGADGVIRTSWIQEVKHGKDKDKAKVKDNKENRDQNPKKEISNKKGK